MSTTIPTEFSGTPSLNDFKIEVITNWYKSALGDMDKASDMDDALYYWGGSDMADSILQVLYQEPEKTVAVVAKSSHKGLKTAAFVAGAVTVYVVWTYRAQIREKFEETKEKLIKL